MSLRGRASAAMSRAWHESDRATRLRDVTLALIRATHPEPTLAVTLVSGLLALAVGHSIGAAALVTASHLAIGWANEAIDATRDARVGRRDKPVAQGRLRRRTVAVAAGVAAVATVVLALPFGPLATAAITVGLAGGLAYDWPLK